VKEGGQGVEVMEDKVDFRSSNELVAGVKFPCEFSVEWFDQVNRRNEDDDDDDD
jgi:hypothetical protein